MKINKEGYRIIAVSGLICLVLWLLIYYFQSHHFGMSLLITSAVILIAFWFFGILLVVGLFCDCKYYFQGMDTTSINLNEICEKASETCGNIKNDFQNK